MDHVVLVLACLIFTCSNCVSGRFTVITQESSAIVGGVAVITCHISIIGELVEVQWIRIQHGKYSIINVFQDGRDLQKCDLPEYIGRTELVTEGLARGSASLKLFSVSVADEGTYRCFLETEYYFDIGDLELRVTALGSVPRIDLEGFQDGGIKAVCRSRGWYPEPTLVTEGDHGGMKIRKEENGLYSIECSKVITENSNPTFTCLIRTLVPHQERESSLYVADGLFQRTADSGVPTIICSVMAAISIVAGVIFATWARQRKRKDAYFGANTEKLHLDVPPKDVLRDFALTESEDLFPQSGLHVYPDKSGYDEWLREGWLLKSGYDEWLHVVAALERLREGWLPEISYDEWLQLVAALEWRYKRRLSEISYDEWLQLVAALERLYKRRLALIRDEWLQVGAAIKRMRVESIQ